MSGKNQRAFRLTPEAREFVDGATVQTDAAQHDTAQHSAELLPWEDLSAGGKTINFKFTPELYAMATYVKHTVPGGISYLELLRRGCEKVCLELIELHGPKK